MDIGEKYHNTNQLQKRFALDCLEKVKGQIKQKFGDEKCKLFDIGTGDGRVLSEVLLEKSELNIEKIVAIDISEEMIALAEKIYHNDLITYKVQDIEDEESFFKFINEHNEGFDLATSYFCLHWIKDLDATFRNIHKSLKAGGIFHFTLLVGSPVFNILYEIADNPNYSAFKNDILKFCTMPFDDENFMGYFEKSLNEAGFTVNFLESKTVVQDYKTAENIKKFFSIFPYFNAIPEEMREKFMDDLVDRKRQKYRELGLNEYESTGTMLHCLATKN